MAKFVYRSSTPDSRTQPRPFQDPGMRRMKFGKIEPMEKTGFFARLLGRS